MMRLLIADVTLTKGHTLHADIRFTGGTTRSLDIPLPKSCVELRTTDAAIVREIDQLLDTYTDAEIADLLNERGVPTATMRAFTRTSVIHLRIRYGLKHRRTRLLEAGPLTPSDLAGRYGVSLGTVHMWRRRGLLRAQRSPTKGITCTKSRLTICPRSTLTRVRTKRNCQLPRQTAKEVQYESSPLSRGARTRVGRTVVP